MDIYGSGAGFQPIYQDLSITTLQANANLAIGASASFQGQIQQHTYAVRDSALSEQTPWNLPGIEVNVRARHNFKDKLIVQTGVRTIAGRRGMQAVPETNSGVNFITNAEDDLIGCAYDLANILDWKIRIEYRYNARLGAWLSGENLLNRSNPLLFGYNSQGTRVTFGFNYTF